MYFNKEVLNGQSAQQRIIVGQFPDYYFDICLCTADTSTLCVHVAYCIYCYVYMYIWCVHVHMVCTYTYGVYMYTAYAFHSFLYVKFILILASQTPPLMRD